ncbi:MAG: transposase [Steroidobacteraceae bacterium]
MSEAELAASPVVGKARRAMRKFTAEQRARIVSDSVAPGATVRTVAERHGVRPNLLSYWRAQAGVLAVSPPAGAPRFVPVSVAAAATVDRVEPAGVIEIDLASGCVRVRGIVDGAMLRAALAASR